MELPVEKLLEECPRFGGVCGPDFNEGNNILVHNDSHIESVTRNGHARKIG